MSKSYSDEEKRQWIDQLRSSDRSLRQVSEESGIPKTTLSDWVKKDEEIGFGEINLKPKNQEIPKVVKKITVFANETVRIELKEGYDKEFVLKLVEVLVNVK